LPFCDKACLFAPVVVLTLLTLSIGFFPQFYFDFAERAAAQLLAPERYIEAVIGGRN
jgi:multicomponent Na+:H+ antiporter subunit D